MTDLHNDSCLRDIDSHHIATCIHEFKMFERKLELTLLLRSDQNTS